MAESKVAGLELCVGIGICALAILVRLSVSLHPYSGAGQPPMYGDYEAQRHWMEITLHLPVHEWYENTTSNDLQYWGLDYPPLTAYHSWLCGSIAHYIDPDWVSLGTSRGYESYDHKLFMRYSVLAVDILIYFTACIVYCHLLYRNSDALWERSSLLAILLLQPALILIDHGHFQYNCVSLGLTFWAVLAVTTDYDVIGSILFTSALNYKQMELYHAMPFFCYLLGKLFASPQSKNERAKKFLLLGLAVIGTFVVCWLPFLGSWNGILQVWHRLFPFGRGLYEDKVANIWCSLSVTIKLKKLLSLSSLIRLTTFSTLLALIPSSWNLLWNPTPHRFLLGLINSSMVFFLFSFQVHEKSILIAILPCSLLSHHYPHTLTWFQLVALFSMYPLVVKDNLVLACWSLGVLYLVVSTYFIPIQTITGSSVWLSKFCKMAATAALLSLLGVCVVSHITSPPAHLPHIFPVLISTMSCLLFTIFTTHTHYLQFTTSTANHTHSTYFTLQEVTKETTDTMETETTATSTQGQMYENTGRPFILSYPLTDKRQKRD